MKIDIVAIPKDKLLLALYNAALYNGSQFDAQPAIRQTVAENKEGNFSQASLAITEKQPTHQYAFSEIDLGAGMRKLSVDLTPFEVDFTEYDALHGEGTAFNVVRKLRTEIASAPATLPLDQIAKQINTTLLPQLNAQAATIRAQNTMTSTTETPSVESEHLFDLENQTALMSDLETLKSILNNSKLTHEQRRSEIRSLNTLHNAFRNGGDACSVAMQMFEAIPAAQWPYLFTYFDAQIIHWSFPHNEAHLGRLKSARLELPEERTNTWLNHIEPWKNILLGTLSSIADMNLDDYNDEYHIAVWALGHIQIALSKSAKYDTSIPNDVLKTFFLKDMQKSMRVFEKITEKSRDKYDFNPKHIVNHAIIASWLPDNSDERCVLLGSIFAPESLKKQQDIKSVQDFLKEPFVRNEVEQRNLILQILREVLAPNGMHLVNFLEKLDWENRRLTIQTLYKEDPKSTETLLVSALNDILRDIPENSPAYFSYIHLLVSMIQYTEIDMLRYLNQIEPQQKIVDAFSHVDFWREGYSNMSLKKIWFIASKLAPENLYPKITAYLEPKFNQYFSPFRFSERFGAAEKIAIPPFHSYSDYLNHHPEEKDKFVQLLLANTQSFTRDGFYKKAAYYARALIPDMHIHLIRQLAGEIKPIEELDEHDSYAEEQNKCLDHLVQVYGAAEIINQCRIHGLNNQAIHLENKFKVYPHILDQVNLLHKWFKTILNPEYRKSDKRKPIEWDKIHKLNEKTLEILSELVSQDAYPNYLVLEKCSEILNRICEQAKVGIDELENALPATTTDLVIKFYPTGALSINGIFARGNNGEHLSKAGMKFANRYLGANALIDDARVIEAAFHKLDSKSQESIKLWGALS